ncbi:MAG: hypothetical protein HXX16_20270 [Bacteroidales bacterium]|nr:hypothetical protein [Bacteroidales bacterium]
MEKSRLNWVVILIAALIAVTYFLIKTDIQTIFNSESVSKISLIILTEIIFYGIFFRIYNWNFFKQSWGGLLFPIFLPLGLTSCFYFFQDSIFLTYLTWVIWILVIVWGQLFLFDLHNILENKKKQTWDILLIVLLAIWITGFAFPELGSIRSLNFHFSSNIYMQIPFLKWIVDLRTIFTIFLFSTFLTKPLTIMDWTLIKVVSDNSIPDFPNDSNTFVILIKAIENGVRRANNYLNNIILNLKILSKRYMINFIISLKHISSITYSTFLMTVSLISAFVLSRIVDIQSDHLFQLIKSSSFSYDLGHFMFVILNTLIIYLLLILNWFLFNANIHFSIKSIKHINKAIWYVFYEYSQILIIKIPGFLFLVLLITWCILVVYNLFANNPFIFPGIYIIICFSIFIIYLIYNKIRQSINNGI